LIPPGRKEKLHFFLFNDILVFANKADVKKQTDMTKLSSQWPIELVWVRLGSFCPRALAPLTPHHRGIPQLGNNTTPVKNEVCWELIGPTTSFSITCQPDEMNHWVSTIQKLLADRGLGT